MKQNYKQPGLAIFFSSARHNSQYHTYTL